MKPRGRPPKPVRRPAAEARALILDAADVLFATTMPDEVGLKEVAHQAGVSHALVTHYFGHYETLVLSTLERRLNAARDRAITSFVGAASVQTDFPLLDALLGIARDATTARLIAWASMSGNRARAAYFAARAQGLRLVVDAIVARIARVSGVPSETIDRRRVEFSVITVVSTVFGLALFGSALEAALGTEVPTLDSPQLREDLGRIVRVYLSGSGER